VVVLLLSMVLVGPAVVVGGDGPAGPGGDGGDVVLVVMGGLLGVIIIMNVFKSPDSTVTCLETAV